jgi:hypothetical protein
MNEWAAAQSEEVMLKVVCFKKTCVLVLCVQVLAAW